MKQFKIVPNCQKYSSVKEFLAYNEFKENDVILFSKAIYEKHFKHQEILAKIMFRSDYGQGEPTSEMLRKMLQEFFTIDCKRLYAIGGGSVIDMAKILAVSTNDDVLGLFKNKRDIKKHCELIAIPTTCGSGSEMSNVAIVEFLKLKTKYGLANDALYANQAILIPELLRDMPNDAFLYGSIDGLIHAIESYLSPKSTKYTRLFQEYAIKTYLTGFKKLVNQELIANDLVDDFLQASNAAGIAFANTGTGAIHAISYPLSGKYHLAHGLANSLFLVEVLKQYERNDEKQQLGNLKKLISTSLDIETKICFKQLENLIKKLVPLKPLMQYQMTNDDVEVFSTSVIENQQRLLSNGYQKLTKAEIMKIYQNLL